ncbi:MAG: HAD hydrolase-like protein [Angelakisella sp.]|jgi:phosphoglycolate phosphatase|nr:HAD hydrolase-like protein [Angelakisella sp.]
MSYRLFIFDLDGTLVDTSPGIMGTVRHVEKTLGIPPIPDEELRRFIGPPLEDSFMRYHGAAPERAKEMVACYRERYGAIGVGEAAVYSGIPEILDAIDAAPGACAAVATLKHHTMAEKSLARFDLTRRFAAIAAGTDARPSKARLIRQVMEELKWEDRSTAVMIGDSRYDGEGALEAGVDFVPLTYGFGFSEPGSLAGLPTVFTAHTPEELVKFVQEALR